MIEIAQGRILQGRPHVHSLPARYLFGLLFVPLLASSQTSDAQRHFEQGRAAFAGEEYARALESFEAALAAQMDGPALHFNIGVAAYRAKQYDRARRAFENVAATPAMSALANYNLGLVALAQNDAAQAIDRFTRVYAESEDERLQALARVQLEKLGQETEPHAITWGAYASSGIGYDDNVTLTSGGQALGITRESDVYGDTLVVGSVQLTRAWRLDADASFLNYADLNEFDQWGIGTGARYRLPLDPWTIDVGARLSTTYIDAERFDVRESVYAQALRSLTDTLSLRARYRLSNVDGSDDYPGLDGLAHELTARLAKRLASWTLGVGYAFEVNDYDSDALSATRHQLGADVRAPVTQAWTARASLAFRHSDYDDTSIGAEERLELGAGAELALTQRWTLAIQYSYTDNNADTPEFTYRRNRVFVGVDATF